MKITLRTSGETSFELHVGSLHHPHTGPLPQVGEILVIPEDAKVDPDARGPMKVKKIIWHYNAVTSALWPEIVCKPA